MDNNKLIGKLVYTNILASGYTTIKSKAVLDAIIKEALAAQSISYNDADFESIYNAVLSYMEVITPSGTNVLTSTDDCDCDDCGDDCACSNYTLEDAARDWEEECDDIEHILSTSTDLTDIFDYEESLNDFITYLEEDFPVEFDSQKAVDELIGKINDLKVLISSLEDVNDSITALFCQIQDNIDRN